MYPTPPDHDPKFFLIDGRHRYCAAIYRGAPQELRCDVISQTGHALRIIPVTELLVDPDVQFDEVYSDRRARLIASEWDDRQVGVLTLSPIAGGLPVRDRAAVKIGLDRQRRRVSPLESFLAAVKMGEPEATVIKGLVENAGFSVGQARKGGPYERIAAVSALQQIFRRMGEEGLRRTLHLNTHWLGDPKSNTAVWLDALALLVRDGYDQVMTPSAWQRWADVVPAEFIRRAAGEVGAYGSSSGINSVSQQAYAIAGALRKRARLAPRAAQSAARGHNQKQV